LVFPYRLFGANSYWNQQLAVIPYYFAFFACLFQTLILKTKELIMTTNTEVAGTSGSLDTSDVGVSSQRLTLALLMLLAGAVLIFTVGFAQGSGGVFHNATHDTRHAVTFPCH
jgi:cobalt transporter subunit CbtB